MKQSFSKEDIKPIVCSLFISLSVGFLVNSQRLWADLHANT